MKVYVRFSLSISAIIFLSVILAGSAVAQSVSVNASVSSTCGNGVVDSGEQCDGSNLNGGTCASRGFDGGTLSCNSDCTFDTSQCTSGSSNGGTVGVGGGGGGGSGRYTTARTSLTLKGTAYPNSSVTLLENGQVVAVTQAGPNAKFEVDLSGMAPGMYNMGVWAEDQLGNRSITQTFQVSITSDASTVISGIFLPPTISIDYATVKKGNILDLSGNTSPDITVTVTVTVNASSTRKDIVVNTTSSDSGDWVYHFPTNDLNYGNYTAAARATAADGSKTTNSALRAFKLGEENIAGATTKSQNNILGDFTGSGSVGIADFSIMAYWYGRFDFPPTVDLNHDGKIDLTDFSILAYYWTN